MICPKCNTINEDNARICCHCGAQLTGETEQRKYEDLRRSMMLILILLGWELLASLLFLFVGNVLIPVFAKGLQHYNYERTGLIYSVTGWFISLVSIALGIVLLVMVRHKAARALLIAYVSVQTLTFFVYRITDLF